MLSYIETRSPRCCFGWLRFFYTC